MKIKPNLDHPYETFNQLKLDITRNKNNMVASMLTYIVEDSFNVDDSE